MKRARKPDLVYDWKEVPVVLDPPYIGRILGMHPDTVTRKIASGEFKGFRVGKFWRMRRSDLMELCGFKEEVSWPSPKT